ncbi:MAG TPA: sodium:solute symporter family protein [Pyrinomonadaceae bacterium]|jgi:Na+/proline symporter|nr:sodium:solute symporter family protein [Pyrinomonadaceae bacterium]
MNFTAVDWAIVIAYLAASVSVGLIGKRYVGQLSHYLVAGRELGLYLGIATLAATEIGTITFMYNAELGYKYGFAAFAAAMISGIVMIIVGRTGFVISRFRELKLMTVPEYFEIKYSRGLRIVTGFLVALGGILNMGVFLKIEGEFLTIVSGIDTRHIVVVMTIILLLELAYTVLGGMVSVVITDFIQYVLLSVATILVSIYAVYYAGWGNIVDKVTTVMGEGGFNPISNPKFGLIFLIWQVLLWFSVHTCWQTTAMRMFSTKGPETSKRVMTWTGFIFLGRGVLPMLWGIAALTLFGTGALTNGVPAPVVNGHTLAPIDAMPAMLANILGPGIRGIVVAGMLAATMSVNSSYLLGWSAVISQDVIMPIRQVLGKGALSSRSQILVNRLANLFVSLFLMFWGLYYTPPGAVYLYLNITGTIFLAGAFVCVIGGLYWRRSNVFGGYLAMLAGAAGAIIPFFFLHWSENITGFTAFGLAAAGMIIGSLLGRKRTVPSQEPVAAD